MPLQVPNLDDRRWADLVEEARSLIPRAAPRWTDHNVHDPGMTFIELFAWLAEMQIYQLNRVGQQHREAFGRLAGVRRRPRTPARVEILARGNLTESVRLEAETKLRPIEGDEMVFETLTEVLLTRSRLLQVIVSDGSEPIDQTEANERLDTTFLAFGERASTNAELRLGFDAFYPNTEPTIRLSVGVFTEDLAPRCGPDLPAPPESPAANGGVQPAELAWEYLAGTGGWIRVTPIRDETAAFTRSGAVVLPVPADATIDRRRVWLRSRIVRGAYDIEPRLRHVGVNGLPCAQLETVRDELLGRGNGRPDQTFPLAKSPVLASETEPPVEVEVAGETWEYVESFEDAGPASKQYGFDPDAGRVLFGNGLNGRVPMPGQDVRAVLYRTSTGRAGNVARNLPWRFRDRVVPGVTLINPEPASGGTDPESLNEMELRAVALLNRPSRAVTLNDIERLALGTPNAYVARAHAVANHPRPGGIMVVAVPKVRPGRTGPPNAPSPAFLAAVQRHLQERRLLCDDLRVVAPIYVEVVVTASLRLRKGAGAAAVIERARQSIDRFLLGDTLDQLQEAPEDGPQRTPCPTRWPFGRPVFPSEVYAVLDQVDGVDSVAALSLGARTNGVALSPDSTGAIRVPARGLVFAGAHAIAVQVELRRAG
jgi:predicted phage baseplate assembly protein